MYLRQLYEGSRGDDYGGRVRAPTSLGASTLPSLA